METASHLFAFIPCRKWRYCGGMTLICANTVEEAVEIGNRGGDGISEGGTFTVDGDATRTWRLVDQFALAEPRPIGVVLSDANYA